MQEQNLLRAITCLMATSRVLHYYLNKDTGTNVLSLICCRNNTKNDVGAIFITVRF